MDYENDLMLKDFLGNKIYEEYLTPPYDPNDTVPVISDTHYDYFANLENLGSEHSNNQICSLDEKKPDNDL